MITIKVTNDGVNVETYQLDKNADTGQVTFHRGSGGLIDFKDDVNAAKQWVLNQVQSDLHHAVGFNVPVREHRTTVASGHAPGQPNLYWGTCACGWVGTKWESRELAQASTTGHYVFPEMVVTA